MTSDQEFYEGSYPDNTKADDGAHAYLVNSNRQHRTELYDRAPIGLVECSLDGKYINVNQEFCRITGYKKDELLRLNMKDLTYEADLATETEFYQALTRGTLPLYHIEKRLVRQNGAVIWVGEFRSLVRDSNGKPLYTIGVISDISHTKAVKNSYRTVRRFYEKGILNLRNS